MYFNIAGYRYRWIENWSKLPDSELGWAHHGLSMLTNDHIVAGHSTHPELFVLNSDGKIQLKIALQVSDIHHICPKLSNNSETLLICDIGSKDLTEQYKSEPKIIEINLSGEVIHQFEKTDFGYEVQQAFKPTAVAYYSLNQRTWVADGYGSSLVHCVDMQGVLLFSLDGTSGAGKFDCPHTVFLDNRGEIPVVLIADRSNHRIQIYSLDGDFIDILSIPELNTPSAFAVLEDALLVVELEARIHVLDSKNQLIETLFDGQEYVNLSGWPNRLVNGQLVAPNNLPVGKLNSPHSICVDKQLNIYLSEWLIGDRFIKLERCF